MMRRFFNFLFEILAVVFLLPTAFILGFLWSIFVGSQAVTHREAEVRRNQRREDWKAKL